MDLKKLSREELENLKVEIDQELVSRPPGAGLADLVEGHDVSEKRLERLQQALELGANEVALIALRGATRMNREDTIKLPQHRLEGLSRGQGWARKGKGASAEWGEREGAFYRVGPGHWVVGGSDGFGRKGQTEWLVEHVKVGDQIWTIAN